VGARRLAVPTHDLIAPGIGRAVTRLLSGRLASSAGAAILEAQAESVLSIVVEKFAEQGIDAAREAIQTAPGRGSLAERLDRLLGAYNSATEEQAIYINAHKGDREALPDFELVAVVANLAAVCGDQAFYERALDSQIDRLERQIDPIGVRTRRSFDDRMLDGSDLTFAAFVDLSSLGVRPRVALLEVDALSTPGCSLRAWVDRDLEDAAIAANRPVDRRHRVRTYRPSEILGFRMPDDPSYAR
jgi:hypothetical protein